MSVAFDSNVNLICEIAFDSNPLDSTQTWTDVSAYLRNFDTSRGRISNLSEFQTGTATVRDSGGASDCNLVFTDGLLTSTTCTWA